MRAREQADAEHVDIFVHGGAHHFLRGLVQPRIDDVHAGVAEAAGDDLHPAIVSVEAHLGDEHADDRFVRHASLRYSADGGKASSARRK